MLKCQFPGIFGIFGNIFIYLLIAYMQSSPYPGKSIFNQHN
jgi:hypothetical protein